MLTDVANIIFQSSQLRCFTISSAVKKAPVIDLTEDDDAWAALDEAEGITRVDKGKGKEINSTPSWLPDGLEPVLEELPKWQLLSDILREAEGEIINQENMKKPTTSCECSSHCSSSV
jgi:DNA excision repair protein ERCC-4